MSKSKDSFYMQGLLGDIVDNLPEFYGEDDAYTSVMTGTILTAIVATKKGQPFRYSDLDALFEEAVTVSIKDKEMNVDLLGDTQ